MRFGVDDGEKWSDELLDECPPRSFCLQKNETYLRDERSPTEDKISWNRKGGGRAGLLALNRRMDGLVKRAA